MKHWTIAPGAELTPLRLGSILREFITSEVPRLNKYKNYYEGKQQIFNKVATDTGKAANKVMVNFCFAITECYLGYLVGKPITYTNDEFEDIIDILQYNDVANEDSQLLRDALVYGKAFEMNYIDEEGEQRFKVLDPRTVIPIYSDTLNEELLMCVRFWKEDPVTQEDDLYFVEVYTADRVVRYKSNMGFSSFTPIEEAPCFYSMCPITHFKLNDREASIFDQIMSLQDAYNNLISGEVDSFDAFADAYLILKGVIADSEDLESMKQHRLLMLDNDADAFFLTKDITGTGVVDMTDNIEKKIHKISGWPDFTDKDFMASSGIALRYKLVAFENFASAIESYMRKALQRRIELINSILTLTDEAWRDVQINFTRNLPTDILDIVQEINGLRGIVSNETLVSLLPFVQDVNEEIEKAREEKLEDMQMYDFNVGSPKVGEDEDEQQ